MKKILFLPIALLIGLQYGIAQEMKYDWKTMKPEQRKQVIQKMKPNERMSLLQEFRENMMVSELDVPQNTQDDFRNLYAEYQAKQNAIKSKFKLGEDYENMSDEEAKRQINESFEIGQQLLDNRKMYAEKFMKFITPQQVLQMYQTEGKMRNKILDKKQDGQRKRSPQSR